jgi:hypothetical protein
VFYSFKKVYFRSANIGISFIGAISFFIMHRRGSMQLISIFRKRNVRIRVDEVHVVLSEGSSKELKFHFCISILYRCHESSNISKNSRTGRWILLVVLQCTLFYLFLLKWVLSSFSFEVLINFCPYCRRLIHNCTYTSFPFIQGDCYSPFLVHSYFANSKKPAQLKKSKFVQIPSLTTFATHQYTVNVLN